MIIKTIKWRKGWVKLWKKLNQISIYDVLNSVWEDLSISDCTKWSLCYNIDNCNISSLIWNLQKNFNVILKLKTLDKL
jgi:DNA-binding IscR family transcriptional regulator